MFNENYLQILVKFYKSKMGKYPILNEHLDNPHFKTWLKQFFTLDDFSFLEILQNVIAVCKTDKANFHGLPVSEDTLHPKLMKFLNKNPLKMQDTKFWIKEYLKWLINFEHWVNEKIIAYTYLTEKGVEGSDIEKLITVLDFYKANLNFFKAPFEQPEEFKKWVNQQNSQVGALLSGMTLFINNLLPPGALIGNQQSVDNCWEAYARTVKNINTDSRPLLQLLHRSVELSPRDRYILQALVGITGHKQFSIGEYVHLLITKFSKNNQEQKNILQRIIKAWSKDEQYMSPNSPFEILENLKQTVTDSTFSGFLKIRLRKKLDEDFKSLPTDFSESDIKLLQTNAKHLINVLQKGCNYSVIFSLLRNDLNDPNFVEKIDRELSSATNRYSYFSTNTQKNSKPDLLTQISERLAHEPELEKAEFFKYNAETFTLLIGYNFSERVKQSIRDLRFGMSPKEYNSSITESIFNRQPETSTEETSEMQGIEDEEKDSAWQSP